MLKVVRRGIVLFAERLRGSSTLNYQPDLHFSSEGVSGHWESVYACPYWGYRDNGDDGPGGSSGKDDRQGTAHAPCQGKELTVEMMVAKRDLGTNSWN
ncbi:hypothetical protein BN77_1797 [Rhizobium mesoamericanum STM3625]|uniref:Uncharacterized protein n=1 Tax=Rhizobium mesoamericanum STM3625 TaxID=1211777 RepID=K0PXR5_9HYPH|nr:hypothetical protein BN77_1797 [Rhizobium mesoamericanum STM3625]